MKSGTAASVALNSATVKAIIVISSIQKRRVRMTLETVCGGCGWCSITLGHERSSVAQCSGIVTTASSAASTRKVDRQSSVDSSAATIGANTVEASPPASVRIVSGVCRASPYRRVITVNAAW